MPLASRTSRRSLSARGRAPGPLVQDAHGRAIVAALQAHRDASALRRDSSRCAEEARPRPSVAIASNRRSVALSAFRPACAAAHRGDSFNQQDVGGDRSASAQGAPSDVCAPPRDRRHLSDAAPASSFGYRDFDLPFFHRASRGARGHGDAVRRSCVTTATKSGAARSISRILSVVLRSKRRGLLVDRERRLVREPPTKRNHPRGTPCNRDLQDDGARIGVRDKRTAMGRRRRRAGVRQRALRRSASGPAALPLRAARGLPRPLREEIARGRGIHANRSSTIREPSPVERRVRTFDTSRARTPRASSIRLSCSRPFR